MALYEIGITGNPTPNQIQELEDELRKILLPTGLVFGTDVILDICPSDFAPSAVSVSTVVYFGGVAPTDSDLKSAIQRRISILPIVSTASAHGSEIPPSISHINALALDTSGMNRIAAAILEAIGLLRRQRKVFISYRRKESTEVALQLFAELESRNFSVFLDTHGVPPAQDFQSILWHELCDCEVVIMLDTATYFASRWSAAEFGRALAKGISILRVGWPSVPRSSQTTTVSNIDLISTDIDAVSGTLSAAKLKQVASEVESIRSLSFAIRITSMQSSIRDSINLIGGKILAVGRNHTVQASLVGGKDILVVPWVGVPTAQTLNDAENLGIPGDIALVYDHVGFLPEWQTHLDWLGGHINSVRWVKRSEIAWCLAGW